MAHFTFIICPVAYFPILRCSKKPVLRFGLLWLEPRPHFPALRSRLRLKLHGSRCFHTTHSFLLRIFCTRWHPFFLFWHKSTNCEIQLKIVECKLISSLGYANYVATICESRCGRTDIFTNILGKEEGRVYGYLGYLGSVTKLFGCRMVCNLNWSELMALVVPAN